MGRTSPRIIQRIAIVLILATVTFLACSICHSEAHQDPCHHLHRCPSDHGTDVCGNKGSCEQCPDHQ